MNSGISKAKPADEDRAQQLVYDAMEASSPTKQLGLIRQALDLDPENVDALLMLLEAADPDIEERVATLCGIVEIGESKLGKEAFEELVPHFWGHLETRPYMRARQALAMALLEVGLLDEAAQSCAEMLALNEGDNQGMRFTLLALLLALKRLDEALALMDRFPDDCEWNVVFSWGRVLYRLLAEGPEAAAGALIAARKQNPHIEIYLTDRRRLPKTSPGLYAPGSKEEAVCYADLLMLAWQSHPKAVIWLRNSAPGRDAK